MNERRRASQPRPTEVRHVREDGVLRISWSDGHVADYTYEYLRGWCPCALCQGHGGDRHFVRSVAPRLAAVEAVGNYAFNLTWADGHQTGIYSYAYLREICPCAACAATSSQPA